jgi:hypothetical protein
MSKPGQPRGSGGDPIPEGVKAYATVLQRQAIDAVNANGGHREKAAASLGLPYTTLKDRIQKATRAAAARGFVATDDQEPRVGPSVARAIPRPHVLSAPNLEQLAAGKARTTFIISDVHAPYHDPEVWATMLAIIRAIRPENVVIIGDFADCYAVSRFTKDPSRRRMLFEELEETSALLDELDLLRVPHVIFTEGNHETRLARLVCERAPELHGLVKTLPEILRVEERGWAWVPYKESVAIGKMRYSHDFTRCGINAARQSLVDVGRSITFGHTHRLGVVYEGTVEDGSHVALNVGWAGLLSAVDYAHRDLAKRSFQHGCGIVDEDERGYVWPQAVAILNGTAMVRGQRVTV